jgi:hypothetical protein
MPTLPWTRSRYPDGAQDAVIVLGSRLELRAHRHVPGFLVAALRVRRQALRSAGAIGVSLRAEPARKTFWTLSAWTDREALDRFVTAMPHARVMRRYHDRMASSGFTTWQQPVGALPAPRMNAASLWEQARDRLQISS